MRGVESSGRDLDLVQSVVKLNHLYFGLGKY